MDSPLKTFLKFSVGTWVNAVVSVISIPIITWFLAPEEVGKAAMFTLAYNLLLNIFLLGQDQSYARHFNEIGHSLRRKLLAETLVFPICFTLLSVIIIEIFRGELSRLLFEDARHVRYVDLLSFVLVIGVVSRFAQLLLRMQNRALIYSVLQVLLTSSNLLFTILYVVFIKSDFSAVIIGFVVSNLLCLVAGVAFELQTWKAIFRFSVSKRNVGEYFRYGFPFVPTFIFDWIFQSTDRAFLRLYSTFSEIGIYTTSVRISASLNVIQTGFSTFWMPFVFEKFSNDENEKLFYQSVFESVYLVFSVVILLIILFRELIFFILPADYHASIQLFPLLLFVPMFYTLSEITGVGINLKKRTLYHFYILMTTSAVSVVLGYFLIRRFGATGAIISSFSSYCCFFILRTVLGDRLYRLNLKWWKFLFTFGLVFIPVLFVFLFPLMTFYYVLVSISLICIFIVHFHLIRTFYNRFFIGQR